METEDPRAALTDPDITVRAAAARDLARVGVFDDVFTLLDQVQSEKSPSVRLYAAAGAAEILARHRGAYDQEPLGRDEKRAVLQALGAFDPGVTPSVLIGYAAFPEPAVLKRLVRMVREPRHGVRVGAVAALRRMALSGASTREGTGVREWVAEALRHPKVQADVATDLLRLIGEVGWQELEPLVSRGLQREGSLEEAAKEALDRLQERDTPEAWNGIWLDEGLDVLQLGARREGEWLAIEGARPVGGRLELPAGVARRIWAPRLGEEGSFEALQMNGRTYWRLAGKRLVGFVEEQDRALGARPEVSQTLLALLDEEKGAAAVRAAALLAVRTGLFEGALERLAKPLSGKKPRNDLFFLQGLALIGVGESEEGRASLERYLTKAKAKEPWRPEAEALLA